MGFQYLFDVFRGNVVRVEGIIDGRSSFSFSALQADGTRKRGRAAAAAARVDDRRWWRRRLNRVRSRSSTGKDVGCYQTGASRNAAARLRVCRSRVKSPANFRSYRTFGARRRLRGNLGCRESHRGASQFARGTGAAISRCRGPCPCRRSCSCADRSCQAMSRCHGPRPCRRSCYSPPPRGSLAAQIIEAARKNRKEKEVNEK